MFLKFILKIKRNPRIIICIGIFILLACLQISKYMPDNVIVSINRQTLIEKHKTDVDLRNYLLTKSDFYDPNLYKKSIELIGASGKFYFMQVSKEGRPIIKYCTKEQAIDMILGNMIFIKYIFNHADYIFVKEVLEKCFDGQLETIFLGEFMTECSIVDEEFSNDLENIKKVDIDYTDIDRKYQWAKENIIDEE
uniref:Uncharacterized protein n=1 Tax=viral metagenome TaxID=1070528 RepID=A0A6M3IST0_9ZZZZ